MSAARRLEASIVASALLHALVLGTVLRGGRVTLRPPLIAIPVALVARPCGGCAGSPLLRLCAARRLGGDDRARALALHPGAPGGRADREPRHGADPLSARRRGGLERVEAGPVQTCAFPRGARR